MTHRSLAIPLLALMLPLTIGSDIDKLMSDVAQVWKNSKPLSQETRADYEKRLNGLIEKSAPNGTPPKPAESVHPPVLVSIEQLGGESFAVVSIRQRQVSLNGEFFNTTKTDAAAVVLKNGRLVRLSIQRELRSKSDVAAAREEMADWAYQLPAATFREVPSRIPRR